MKIHISDISTYLSPQMPEVREDRELSERIKDDVFRKIGIEEKKVRKRTPLRIALIAAAITALLTVTGLAASNYTMNNKKVQEGEKIGGIVYVLNGDGETWSEVKTAYPNAGMTFDFNGADNHNTNQPELRANWLPRLPNEAHICGGEACADIDKLEYSETDDGIKMETWTSSVTYDPLANGTKCKPDESEILYSVGVNAPLNNMTYVLQGEVTVEKEEDWDNRHVLMVSSDYKKLLHYDRIINYVFMFDETTGYFVRVAGAADMETLEKIARNIEVRESGTPYEPEPAGTPRSNICIMDLGRG